MKLDIDVVKRDGEVTKFDRDKIFNAINRAYESIGINDFAGLNTIVTRIEEEISNRFNDSDLQLNVENIHDIVEKQLMFNKQYEVAKAYILYRAKKREREIEDRKKISFLKTLFVVKKNGNIVKFDPKKLKDNIKRHSVGLTVDQNLIFCETSKNVFNQMKASDIDKALVMSATSFIEQDPSYSYLAARFFHQKLAKEVFSKSVKKESEDWKNEYRDSFVRSIQDGCSNGTLDARLLNFDLTKLAPVLVLERDELFKYMGIQTLYERYFIKNKGRRTEMPQTFWMRVAMGLSINEEKPVEKAIEFYHLMSQLLYIPSTPTLFHSGLHSPQLSSCYLSTVDDDLKHIFQSFSDNAQMSKWSGGIGNDWTNVRSTGANIKSTMVESQGVIPFLKIANDTTVAINRSGKRRGATAAYLETWHLDIEDFLDLRKNTGDERRRTPDMDTVNWIPDLFFKRVQENGNWTLFSPDEVPDLHHIYGSKFEERYAYYESQAAAGKIVKFKVVEASKLMRKMVTALFETGHPWFTFKDPCNIRSPQDHVGVVHNSNLCCVTADQLVTTTDGLMSVGEMYSWSKNKKWTLAGKDGLVTASEMLLPRPNGPIVKIVTEEGYTHKVTPDHKVWTVDDGYKEAQHLVAGDKISLQSTFGLWGNINEPKLSFLMGLVAGDGTFSQNSVHIDIWDKDAFVINEVEELVAELISEYKNLGYDQAVVLHPKFNHNEQLGKYRLSSSALNQILKTFGFKPDSKFNIPNIVRFGNKNTVKAYLRGLYLADGTVQGGEVTVGSLCSVNKQLLEHLQVVWLNFGAKTSLTQMDEEGCKNLSDGNGGQKEYYCQAKYSLMHTSIRACKILEEVTNIGSYRKCQIFLDNLKKDGYQQKMHATFKGLEQLSNEDAYCLQVDSEDHLWTVNGMLTKNTEITLNTSPTKRTEDGLIKELGEVAVCNLGSINVVRHMKNGKVDWELLKTTIVTAVRMLDNVIDINFYPIPEAKNSNLRHRPVGLGFMGYQDALFVTDLRYEESDDFADELQEYISYYAISSSSDLAAERGTYQTYEGSKWHRGLFPLDTIEILENERGLPIEVDRKSRLDWAYLKDKVSKNGMRNSNVMAVAPTATISTIAGLLGPAGEAIYKNIFAESNMSGEYTVINEYLVNDLKKLNLWDKEMIDQIKFHNGSVQKIERIPLKLRTKYKEVFEIDQKRSIDLTALRSKWIDQSQSHNIFANSKSGNYYIDLYTYAWKKGLKTTYYLRGLGATGVEKSTLDTKFGLTQKRNEVQNVVSEKEPQIKLCKINDPTCESCQ